MSSPDLEALGLKPLTLIFFRFIERKGDESTGPPEAESLVEPNRPNTTVAKAKGHLSPMGGIAITLVLHSHTPSERSESPFQSYLGGMGMKPIVVDSTGLLSRPWLGGSNLDIGFGIHEASSFQLCQHFV